MKLEKSYGIPFLDVPKIAALFTQYTPFCFHFLFTFQTFSIPFHIFFKQFHIVSYIFGSFWFILCFVCLKARGEVQLALADLKGAERSLQIAQKHLEDHPK